MNANEEFLKVCEYAARTAGATLTQWVGKTHTRLKGPADLVTEADLASQEVIRKILREAFPEHELVGEEGHEPGKPRRADYRWIADPLDGTTNYVHGVPHYAVSLALECRGKVLVGAIYDPNRDECYSAALGQGAFLNGERLRTSDVATLGDALGGAAFPAKVTDDSLDFRVFNEAVFELQGIRRTGSAALNLCYLAAGRFDVLWAFSTKIWDVAAGILLVEEAGGTVASPEGGEFVLESARYIAAANPQLFAVFKQLVGRVAGGKARF